MLTQADFTEFMRLAETTQVNTDHLAELETGPEILGYAITIARSHGSDEGDAVELLTRSIDLKPSDVRAAARVLGQLGYRLAAERLRWLAGRRQRNLRPFAA